MLLSSDNSAYAKQRYFPQSSADKETVRVVLICITSIANNATEEMTNHSTALLGDQWPCSHLGFLNISPHLSLYKQLVKTLAKFKGNSSISERLTFQVQ